MTKQKFVGYAKSSRFYIPYKNWCLVLVVYLICRFKDTVEDTEVTDIALLVLITKVGVGLHSLLCMLRRLNRLLLELGLKLNLEMGLTLVKIDKLSDLEGVVRIGFVVWRGFENTVGCILIFKFVETKISISFWIGTSSVALQGGKSQEKKTLEVRILCRVANQYILT